MDKLQMAHDFSMEVILKIQETLELLMPIAGLATIIIIGIIEIIIICTLIASIIKNCLERRDRRR